MLGRHSNTSGKCWFSVSCFYNVLLVKFHFIVNACKKTQHEDFLKFPPLLSCQNVRCSHVSHGSTAAGRCVATSVGLIPAAARTPRHRWNNRKCVSERRFPPWKTFRVPLRLLPPTLHSPTPVALLASHQPSTSRHQRRYWHALSFPFHYPYSQWTTMGN
jgi:hypothetical protein